MANGSTVASRAAFLIALAVGLLSVTFGIFGIPGFGYSEGGRIGNWRLFPAPHAFISATANILVMTGLAVRKIAICWFGVGMLVGFAVTFFFGIGALYLPVAAALVGLLAVAQRKQN